MRLNVLLLLVVAFAASSANAAFIFEGSTNGGTAKGELDFSGLGTDTITVTVKNLSPAATGSGSTDVWASAITAFGFDAQSPIPSIVSWSLTAQDAGGTTVTIGGVGSTTNDWVLSLGSGNGIKLDFVPNTDNGVNGAIYAAGETQGFGGSPNYFSDGVLTINFDDTFNLSVNDGGMGEDPSPTMRFQNVGTGGEGSLKLTGEDDSGVFDSAIPEPASLAAWGVLGLVGAAGMVRRRFRKKS